MEVVVVDSENLRIYSIFVNILIKWDIASWFIVRNYESKLQ